MATKKAAEKPVTLSQALKHFGWKAQFFRAIKVPHQTGYDWFNRLGYIPDAYQSRVRKAMKR